MVEGTHARWDVVRAAPGIAGLRDDDPARFTLCPIAEAGGGGGEILAIGEWPR